MKTLKNSFTRLNLIVAAIIVSHAAKADLWNTVKPMGTATLFHSSTLLRSGNVLVAGGQAAKGASKRAELFDPLNEKWTDTGDMFTERIAHSAVLLPDGKVLV